MPPRGQPGLRGGGGAAGPHAQRGGGPGGGAGYSDRLANIERQLSILAQQAAGAQAAPRGAAAGGGGRRTGGAGPVEPRALQPGPAGGGASGVARPGDWRCGSCGAYPCWARTVRCFKCRAPRPEGPRGAASGGGGGRPGGSAGASLASTRADEYLGPRGAYGNRPLLGRRGSAQPAPAPPGAGAVGGQARETQRRDDGQQRPRRAPISDEDGFQTVTRHVRPRVGDALPNGASAAAGVAGGGGEHGRPASWAEVARRPMQAVADDVNDLRNGDGDDMDRDDGDEAPRADVRPGDRRSDSDAEEVEAGEDEEDEDVDGEHEEGAAEVCEEELRRAWEEAKAACRQLERAEGMPHAVVDAARRHRDEAEENWRAARRPHPLHKRLRWAQRDLDAAIAKQQAHQAEMDRALEEMAQRKRALEERAEADKLRTERKRRALQALHDDGAPPPTTSTACEDAAKAAVVGIQSELGPTLCGVADRLECGSPEWQELQTAMAALHQVQGLLQGACTEVEAVRAATGDQTGDGDDDQRWQRRQQPQQQRQTAGGPTRFDIGDDAEPKCQDATDVVPNRAASSEGAGGTGRPAAPAVRWAGPSRVAADRWGGPAWRKTRHADGAQVEKPPAAAGTLPATTAAGAGGAPTHTSAAAKEEARRQLEVHKAQLVEAQRAAAQAAEAAETVKRAQEAVARAEAEEAQRLEREKLEAAARMSPAERRMAEDLHAQQAAIAAAGFGTEQAARGANLVQQAAAGIRSGGGDGVDDIMAMSPEQWQESLPVDPSAMGW